jgi:glycosyltransferase involved in cell wall biosynthesis
MWDHNKQNKNVALIGPYPPPYGGISTFMLNLQALLLLHNFSFKFLAFRSANLHSENTIPISSGLQGVLALFTNLMNVDIALDCTEFCLEYPSWRRVYLWLFTKRLTKFRWIKMVHNGSLPMRYKSFSLLQRKVFKHALSHIDELIVVNDELANWVKNTFDYRRPIVVVGSLLPSQADELFHELDAKLLQFLHEHEKIVCSIGVFTQVYGFDDVVETVEELRTDLHKNIGVVLIDAGFDREPGFQHKITANREWIYTLKGIPISQVKDILKQSDIFVRATKYESYGLSRVEAIFCEKPVVATNVGETRGMLLYEYGDRKTLREQIQRALFSSTALEQSHWSEFYRQQADENWSKLRDILDD